MIRPRLWGSTRKRCWPSTGIRMMRSPGCRLTAQFDALREHSELDNKETRDSMPYLTTNDGVKLYYEDSGAGRAILFIHEFSGDYRAWELQVQYFARRYRCITYNARGYPPSDVPESVDKYSQRRARDDIRAVMDALKIDKAHIVGLSMGGFATVHFGMTYHDRARSLVIA